MSSTKKILVVPQHIQQHTLQNPRLQNPKDALSGWAFNKATPVGAAPTLLPSTAWDINLESLRDQVSH